ncbi:MAG: triose-phosphate isomerase [Chloroflexota bacterium]
MRKPMMAGNWKMNKTVAEGVELATAIRDNVANIENVGSKVDCVLCTNNLALAAISEVTAGTSIVVGAQNMHWAESGAYTGEVSASMLTSLPGGNVTYVIIGHSERREYFAESDETVNRKTHAALASGLTPIVCIGESLAQNEAGETHAFVSGQVKAALEGLSGEQVQSLVLAYEPIWAIGTGKAATAEQANEICGGTVRSTVAELYGEEVAANTRVLYGGSTKDSNIQGIMEQPDIDGALIGGASLQADNYSNMVRITSELYS